MIYWWQTKLSTNMSFQFVYSRVNLALFVYYFKMLSENFLKSIFILDIISEFEDINVELKSSNNPIINDNINIFEDIRTGADGFNFVLRNTIEPLLFCEYLIREILRQKNEYTPQTLYVMRQCYEYLTS